MRYLVMIHRTDTGYSADAPDLPGCVAAAKTLKGVQRLMAEAIEFHLDLMRQSGGAIPAPRQRIEFAIDPDTEQEFCTWVEVPDPQPEPA